MLGGLQALNDLRHEVFGLKQAVLHGGKHTDVPVPKPLTVEEKKRLLEMIIKGERETPTYIKTGEGLKMIFVEPGEDEVEDARRMLRELKEAEQMQWMM
jgi:hypothetical protein